MRIKNGLVEKICIYNKAMSEPQRLKMMKILGSSLEDTVCVSDIANILCISQPAATKHLKILYDANLVNKKRIGTSVYYSVNKEVIDDYRHLMDYAFVQVFKPCLYEYNCDECPYKETCN